MSTNYTHAVKINDTVVLIHQDDDADSTQVEAAVAAAAVALASLASDDILVTDLADGEVITVTREDADEWWA